MINKEFIVGQRWISNTELQLGLGTVQAVEHRIVQIDFTASGESRTYARDSAPLTRVRFSVGDRILDVDGISLVIESVSETDGLITYHGTTADAQPVQIPETQLDASMRLSRPADRLLAGIIDKPKWFELRNTTRQHKDQLAQSDLYGLVGTRTSLIPHQLYIANEVAQRYAPRVLLADEVGLGKTIEAGLILHQQILTERVARVLIIVPETLVHQWLVEMLRRFNLSFSVFDEQRCQAIESSGEQPNPFHAEQLILCPLSLLTENETRQQQASAGEWDLVVVDEAHHLQWTPENASIEYRCVEQIATLARGLLLLTATPEQLGKSGHFARLRLLDPDRFADFAQFEAEEQNYQPIANAVEHLLSDNALNEENEKILAQTLQDEHSRQLLAVLTNAQSTRTEKQHTTNELINQLLDRHGTGRVLFRNTRAAIKGFPERLYYAYPLPLPDAYHECLGLFAQAEMSEHQLLLCPELLYSATREDGTAEWFDIDPRIEWLKEKLTSLREVKTLVITASADSALDIAQFLKNRHGLHAAVFHEDLSIVERDRAAAFFADQENGTQVLICSEIGSEGRNFQFSHNLILFDLPLNPDLLEQRIGRLDRIGQKHDIKIHAPYLDNTAQALMQRWYHEGLDAFEKTCPAGQSIYKIVADDLAAMLKNTATDRHKEDSLISKTSALLQQFNLELQQGRDRLLEFSSYRPDVAMQLIDKSIQQEHETELSEYLDRIFDNFAIETEVHGQHSYVIHPTEHTHISLPGLTEDGMTITYHRETALSNEDMHYLTWEHPLVQNVIDHVLSNETGNTAMVTIQHKAIKAGTLFIECIYNMESASTTHLNTARFLPGTQLRIITDHSGKDASHRLDSQYIATHQQLIKRETAKTIISSHAPLLKQILKTNNALANKLAPEKLEYAIKQASDFYNGEIRRLQALARNNANIRTEEIEYFQQQRQDITERLNQTQPQLDAIRILIAT